MQMAKQITPPPPQSALQDTVKASNRTEVCLPSGVPYTVPKVPTADRRLSTSEIRREYQIKVKQNVL